MNINYMTKEIVTDWKAFIIGIRSDEPYFRNGKAKELDLYSYELLHMYYKWLFYRNGKLPLDIAERMKSDYIQNCSFKNLKKPLLKAFFVCYFIYCQAY